MRWGGAAREDEFSLKRSWARGFEGSSKTTIQREIDPPRWKKATKGNFTLKGLIK